MTRAKSLLEVKDGLTLPGRHRRARSSSCAQRTGARLPLVLMNSLRHARRHRSPRSRATRSSPPTCPLDFVQSKVPKLAADDLAPVEWPADPGLEWAPPGHGDLYTALVELGDARRAARRTATATRSSRTPTTSAPCSSRASSSWFAREEIPFADGGRRPHRGRPQGRAPRPARRDGGLVLREIAQTPDDDVDAFQDIEPPPLLQHQHAVGRPARARATLIDERDGVLGLPMIVNRKTVDPGDKSLARRSSSSRRRWARRSTCSTAPRRAARAAAALRAGEDDQRPARAALGRLRADRRRARRAAPERPRRRRRSSTWTPTTTSCCATSTRASRAARRRCGACESLTVNGDVTFGRDVVVKGRVEVEGPREVADGEVLA